MSQDIWTQCAPKFKLIEYQAHPWRVVEAQHVVATRKLVDSDEEQEILEELLDEAKPPLPNNEELKSYHYLLWTPFRYPPLEYGSRFGSPDRQGIWYGSERIETAFAEKAYYTFLFRAGSQAHYGVFETPVSVFSVPVVTKLCADLTQSPFAAFEDQLTSPHSYAATQPLGSKLRDLKTELICFKSARCPDRGLNFAVTKISAFQKKQPTQSSTWFCVSSEESVEFKPIGIQPTVARTRFKKS